VNAFIYEYDVSIKKKHFFSDTAAAKFGANLLSFEGATKEKK